MSKRIQLSGPVVVTGVGGSGTIVITQMLMDMGFYMGNDLNLQNDNMLFAFLFFRPKWFMNLSKKDKESVSVGLGILRKVMAGAYYPSLSELSFISHAIADHPYGIWFALNCARRMFQLKRTDSSKYIGWGWKEPIAHIYLDYLNEYFANLRVIYLIRHGLDMAYSENQNQRRYWGSIFKVDRPGSIELRPKASLEYWIKANQKAIALGMKMGNDKFLLLNFDNLCLSPRTEVDKMLSFLKIDPATIDVNHLCGLVKPPKGIGRYREHDLSIFSSEDISAVKTLGFAL